MAKKGNDLDLDDLDFDDFDDIEDLDLSMDGSGNNRNPVKKLATSFYAGAVDDITNTRDLTRKLRNVIPDEYGSSIDLVDQTSGTLSSLYNTIVRETVNPLRQFKKASGRLLKRNKDKLPKGIGDTLESVLKVEDEYKSPSAKEMRENSIDSSLNNIFEAQTKIDQVRINEERSRETIKDAVDKRRYATNLDQLFSIRDSLQRQVTFQDQITARYQRKSLELQYRQLFATKDIKAITKQSSIDTKTALESIVHNTALPEHSKITLKERSGGLLKDKLIGNAQNKVSEWTSGFTSNLTEKLEKKAKELASELGNQISQIAGGIDMAEDMAGMIDPVDMAGRGVGGWASKKLFEKLSPAATKLIKSNPQLMKMLQEGSNLSKDMPRVLNEWAKKQNAEGGSGGIKQFIAELIDTSGIDSSVTADGIENSEESAFFDKITRQSIVEIIPGYLSRIHSELRSVRSGMGFKEPDEGNRLVYNLKNQDFGSKKELKNTVAENIFTQSSFDSATDELDKMYSLFGLDDFLSGDELAEAKAVLGRTMLREHFNKNQFKIERFIDPQFYGDADPTAVKSLVKAVKKSFGIRKRTDEKGSYYKQKNSKDDTVQELLDVFRDISSGVDDPGDKIRGYHQSGHRDELEKLGLTTRDSSGNSSVNYNKVFEIYQRGGLDGITGTTPSGGNGSSIHDGVTATAFVGNRSAIAGGIGSIVNRGNSLYEDNIKDTVDRGSDLIDETIDDLSTDKGRKKLFKKAKKTYTKAKRTIKDPKKRKKYLNGLLKKAKDTKGYQLIQDKIEKSEKAQTTISWISKNYELGKEEATEFYDAIKDNAFDDFYGVETESKVSTVTSMLTDKIKATETYGKAKDRINGSEKAQSAISWISKNYNLGKEEATKFYNEVSAEGGVDKLLDKVKATDTYGKISDKLNPSNGDSVNVNVDEPNNGDAEFNEFSPNGSNEQSTSPSTLSEIRDILRGEEKGVGRDTEAIVKYLNVDREMTTGEAQVTILGTISSHIEAISKMMASNDKESWFNILDIGKKSGRAMKAVAKAFGSYGLGTFKMAGGIFSGIGSIASGAGKALGGGLGKLVGSNVDVSKMGPKDIYLKEGVFATGNEPALTAKGMKAGIYVDSETGDPITSVADLTKLKGDILDITDPKNPITAATAEDLSKGIFDRFGSKIGGVGLLAGLTNIVSKGISGMFGIYKAIYSKPLSIAKSLVTGAYGIAKGIVNRVVDVFVKGEEKPRLLAMVMKNGGYVNASDGKPITKVTDINGDVMDLNGNLVLSLDDMNKGLCTWGGRPLGFFARQLSRILSVGKFGLGLALKGGKKIAKGYAWAAKKAAGVVGIGAKVVTGKINIGSNDGSSEVAEKQLSVLEKIYAVLKGEKKISLSGFKSKSGKYTLSGTIDPEGSSHNPMQSGFRKGGWKARLLAKNSAAEKKEAKVKVKRDKKEKKGLVESVASKVLPIFSSIKTAVVTALTTVVTYAMAKLGIASVGGALMSGLATVGTAALGGLATVGSGLLAVGGAVLGVLSAPVIAVVGAVAAVGIGGYFLWRHFQKKKVEGLNKLRMLQYGVKTVEGTEDRAAKVLWLEDYLSDKVDFTNGEMSFKGVDWDKVSGNFGVKKENKEHVMSYIRWLNGRFLPVYKKSKITLAEIDGDYTLDELEDLSKMERARFIKNIREVQSIDDKFGEPYDVSDSPFSGTDQLMVSRTDIYDLADELEKKLDVDINRRSINRRTRKIMRLEKNAALNKTAKEIEKETGRKITTSNVKELSTKIDTYLGKRNITGEKVSFVLGAGMGNLKTLDVIRMKTYGLDEMEWGKVMTLMKLEEYVMDNVKAGSDNIYAFTDTVENALELFRTKFGIGDWWSDEEKDGWMTWFKNRFLKVFLTYLNGISHINKNVKKAYAKVYDDKKVCAQIALIITSLKVNVGGSENRSVWTLSTSPWEGYILNNDGKSVYKYVGYLNDQAKKEIMSPSDFKSTSSSKASKGVKQSGKSISKSSFSFDEKGKTNVKKQGVKPASNASNYIKTQNSNLHNGVDTISGGMAFVHPGNGVGGSVNDIPLPDGDGSWGAHKNTIVAAAKMVGVDPGVMATMAAIESGFDSKAVPKNKRGKTMSSAKGLYQFIDKTWNDMMSRYGDKYGIAKGTSQFDPRANALLGAEFLRENTESMSKHITDRNLTDTDLYAAHFLGAAGAGTLLGSKPDAIAAKILPKAALSNPTIFNGGGGRRTVAEVYQELDRRVVDHRTRYAGAANALAANYVIPKNNYSDDVVPSPVKVVSNVVDINKAKKTTPTRAMSMPTTTLASAGISEAVNRNNDDAIKRTRSNLRHAVVRDEEESIRNKSSANSLRNISKILTMSLKTQLSMDDHLGDISKVLQERDGEVAIVESDKDDSKNDKVKKPKKTPKQSEVGKSIIKLKKRQSI